MKYLLFFCVFGPAIGWILMLFGMMAYGYVNQTAFLCFRCKGNGQDKHDPLFECEECKGTGLLICETYSVNYPDAIWIKPLWFRWETKKTIGV